MASTSRPFRNLASSDVDARPLKGFASNLGHESDPHGVLLPYLTARNQEALVLSATGQDLDDDLAVSEGHKHDDGDSRILWHQLLSIDHNEDESNNDKGALVTQASAETIALLPLLLPTVLYAGGPLSTSYYGKLRLRFRVTVPGVGSAGHTTLYLKVTFYKFDMSDAYFSRQIAVQSSASRSYDEEFVEALIDGPIDGWTPANIDDAEGRFQLLLEAWIETAGDVATLWETQLAAE